MHHWFPTLAPIRSHLHLYSLPPPPILPQASQAVDLMYGAFLRPLNVPSTSRNCILTARTVRVPINWEVGSLEWSGTSRSIRGTYHRTKRRPKNGREYGKYEARGKMRWFEISHACRDRSPYCTTAPRRSSLLRRNGLLAFLSRSVIGLSCQCLAWDSYHGQCKYERADFCVVLPQDLHCLAVK